VWLTAALGLAVSEMARDHLHAMTDHVVIGGYLSPVSDAYGKLGLASRIHRMRMAELGAWSSGWLSVDGWEAASARWRRSLEVLQHFDREINGELAIASDSIGKPWGGGFSCASGQIRHPFFRSFSPPNFVTISRGFVLRFEKSENHVAGGSGSDSIVWNSQPVGRGGRTLHLFSPC
jgi:hypothetical protein